MATILGLIEFCLFMLFIILMFLLVCCILAATIIGIAHLLEFIINKLNSRKEEEEK